MNEAQTFFVLFPCWVEEELIAGNMFFSTGANNAHGRGSAAAPPRLRPGAAAPSSSGPERGLGGSRHAGGALRNSGAGAGAACEGKLGRASGSWRVPVLGLV